MVQRTRRQFLQESLYAAAALSAAPMFSGRAAAQSTSPNDKLLCAVIGCNGRGGDHINAYARRKDCEIAYIVDIDEKVGQKGCEAVEKKTGRRPKWVKDMRQVFDDKSIHFISTATPNHWHALCGVWAMQAGKDAYIEKPICHDIPEGAALVAAAKKYGTDLPGGDAMPLEPGGPECREVHGRGRHRPGQLRPRAVLQTPQVDRRSGRLPDSGGGGLQPVERSGPVHARRS